MPASSTCCLKRCNRTNKNKLNNCWEPLNPRQTPGGAKTHRHIPPSPFQTEHKSSKRQPEGFLPAVRARQIPATLPNSSGVEPFGTPRISAHIRATSSAGAGAGATVVRTANESGGKRRRGPDEGDPLGAHHRAGTYQVLVTSPI